MHNKFRFLGRLLPVLSAVAAIGLIACTAPASPAPDSEPTAPDATLPAAGASSANQQDIPVADFVQQHSAISESWDQFHGEFDQWSASLAECHPNALREAVNDFAISFNSVTEQARGLTRGKTSGEIADLLIVAAEGEEAAFRQLRDRWQPNNISLFENVEQHRTKASQAQKSAEDRVIQLRDGFEDAADPEATAEFLEAFEPIRDDWKQLHEEYETLREEAESLGDEAVLDGIEQHVETLGGIIDAIEDLPELEGAEETVEELLTVAKTELEAFEAATAPPSATETTEEADSSTSSTVDSTDGSANGTNGSTNNTDAATTDQSTGSADAATTDQSTSGTDATTTDSAAQSAVADSATNGSGSAGGAFPDLEPLDEITEANAKVLKAANRTIEDLADPDAERGLAELQVFDTEYARMVRAWDAFHAGYNDWRKDDGGCDRAQVVQDLEEHSLQIAEIARDVRGLPSAGPLLPIYSLLTEAAARDEDAIRTLRYTWQPFALDAFKAVHQERTNTESLRRQAEIAVQELANRS